MAEAVLRRRAPVVPSGVFGMLLFVITEVMLFGALVSAFTITRTASLTGAWPPPGQPRLPVEATAVTTAALVMSGVLLFVAHRKFSQSSERARLPLLIAFVLGLFFVGAQGFEWVAMLRQGLTMTSSTYGAFFYLIIGCHALHAIGALFLLGRCLQNLYGEGLKPERFWTAQVLWYFVVGVWPVLYLWVYLT